MYIYIYTYIYLYIHIVYLYTCTYVYILDASCGRISFTSAFFKSATNCLIAAVIAGGAGFLLLWHFVCAYKHNQTSGHIEVLIWTYSMTHRYLCTYICIYVYVYICTWIYMCIYMYMDIYIYVYIYIYLCLYIYRCISKKAPFGRLPGLQREPLLYLELL